jgi:cystathionine beta-lyase
VHFHQDIVANGRRVVNAPLTLENGRYRFDPERFEAAIAPDTKLFILCNPHNPTGNVWSRADLVAMGEICRRHGVLVIADEVHEDLVLDPALKHIPFASLGEEFAANCFVCTAPSKTFNLAGLQCSNIFVPNDALRAELSRHKERCGLNLVNLAGLTACETAYRDGEPWLEAALAYIRANQAHFAAAVNGTMAGFRVLPAESLYLAWMDCRGLGLQADALNDFMLTHARLWLDRGEKYGPEGHGFMRVNLACPRSLVDEAIARLGAACA